MDILQQSLEAADILSPEDGYSELPDELMLGLSEDVSSSTDSFQASQNNNLPGNNEQTINNVPRVQAVPKSNSVQAAQFHSNQQKSLQHVVNVNQQQFGNPQQISISQQQITNIQPQQQVLNQQIVNQRTVPVQFITGQQGNKFQLVNNQMQQQVTAPKQKPQVMLVQNSQSQQNGIYQIVNVAQQQNNRINNVPLKQMVIQQSNGQYVVSPLNVQQNIQIAAPQNTNKQIITSNLTQVVANNASRNITNSQQNHAVSTAPSSGLFSTKLPAGIRVVQQLAPAKTEQTQLNQNANNINIIGRKVLSYQGNKVVAINTNNATNNQNIIGVQLNNNQQAVQIIKPENHQNNLQQKNQFVNIEQKPSQRTTQVPIKGIQIASVNIPVANENVNNSSNMNNNLAVRQFQNNEKINVINNRNIKQQQQSFSTNNTISRVASPQPTQIVRPLPQSTATNQAITNVQLSSSPKPGSPGPGKIPPGMQIFRVEPTLTEQQADEVRNLIVSRTIVSKMRTLAREQQQLVLAFQAYIRSMGPPVQQYYLRNPQLFVQKVLQVTSQGKPYIIQARKPTPKQANAMKLTTNQGPQQAKPEQNHPTISLGNQDQQTVTSHTNKPAEARTAVKRPIASTANPLSLILEQMECHKKIVLTPSCSKPFVNNRDALRRLLPYHICNLPNINEKYFNESESMLENYADKTMKRIQKMYDKYHLLCLRDVTRKACSAEMVMVERIFLQHEKASFANDKILVTNNPEAVKQFFPAVKQEMKEEKIEQSNFHNNTCLKSDDYQSGSDSESNPPSSSNHSFHQSSLTNPSSDNEDSILQAAVDSILS